MLNKGVAQLMGNIADELGLGFVQGDFAGNVLHRNGQCPLTFSFSLIRSTVFSQKFLRIRRLGCLPEEPRNSHRFRISQHRLK